MVKQALTPMIPQSSVGNPDFFRSIVYEICPDFEADKFNISILNDIFDYVHGKGNLDPNKGIWFWGDIGNGKSTLLKILAEYQRTLNRGFKCIDCRNLSSEFSSKSYDALNESCYNETHKGSLPVERGFDELGREPIPSKYYIIEINIMQYVLQDRYILKDKVKTHVTTNLQLSAITSLYGNHIADRAKEMFNFIEVKGKSRRK